MQISRLTRGARIPLEEARTMAEQADEVGRYRYTNDLLVSQVDSHERASGFGSSPSISWMCRCRSRRSGQGSILRAFEEDALATRSNGDSAGILYRKSVRHRADRQISRADIQSQHEVGLDHGARAVGGGHHRRASQRRNKSCLTERSGLHRRRATPDIKPIARLKAPDLRHPDSARLMGMSFSSSFSQFPSKNRIKRSNH